MTPNGRIIGASACRRAGLSCRHARAGKLDEVSDKTRQAFLKISDVFGDVDAGLLKIEEGVLARKAGKGQQEFLVIKLNDVIITGVTHGGSTGDGIMQEQVSLNFAKVALEYKPQKPDGSLDAAVFFKYDLKAQKEA